MENGAKELKIKNQKACIGEEKIPWIDSTLHWPSYDFKDARFDIWVVFSISLSVCLRTEYTVAPLHFNFSSFCFCIRTNYLVKYINHTHMLWIIIWSFPCSIQTSYRRSVPSHFTPHNQTRWWLVMFNGVHYLAFNIHTLVRHFHFCTPSVFK